MAPHLLVALLALGIATSLDVARGAMSESRLAPAFAQDRPKIGETITTESGLVYKFTQLGKGPQPKPGDLMIIHGIGNLADGKEFWNTRTDGAPYEYTLGVDSVIKGFSEGMTHVREGDRIIITMKPELGYGARERTGIPANSTLTFDYEILAVKPLSFAKLMREAIAAGTVDEAIAKAKAMPNLKDYYVSASSIQAAATVANRKEAGSNEKVIALGITLLPTAYQLHQTLGRLQATRGDKPAAIKSYEAALRLNPKRTAAEIRDHEATTAALAALR
jgi:tetratricopeptide (TPR) repeat protein